MGVGRRPISKSEFYKDDGQIDWDSLREDHFSRCTPEERLVKDMSVAEIFKMHGWSRDSGDKPASEKFTPQDPKDISQDTRIKVVIDYNNHAKVDEIAKRYRLHATTIRRILQRAGAWDASRKVQ